MQQELNPEQKALVDACALLAGNAIKGGMHPAQVLAVMQSCTAELESVQPLLLERWQALHGGAGQQRSATQQALERMAQQPGGGTLEDLMKFMADAGATVIVSDQQGTRQVQPEPPEAGG